MISVIYERSWLRTLQKKISQREKESTQFITIYIKVIIKYVLKIKEVIPYNFMKKSCYAFL